VGGLADGFKKAHGRVVGAAHHVIEETVKDNSVVKKAETLGHHIVFGLSVGIRSPSPAVVEAVEGLAKEVLRIVKDALAIKSPSRKMMEIGRFVGEGLANGIDSGKAIVGASTKGLVTPISEEAKKAETSIRGIGPVSGIASTGFKGMGTAMKGAIAGSGFGLLLTLFAPLIQMLVETIQKTKAFQAIMKLVGVAMAWIGKIIDVVFSWIVKHWQLLLAILTGPFGLAILFITKNWKKISEAIGVVVDWIKKNWQLLLAILTGPIGLAVLVITKNWDKIKNGVSGVKDWIVGAFTSVLHFFTGLPDKVGRIFDQIWQALPRGVKAAINTVIDALNGLNFGFHFHHFGLNIDVPNVFPKIPRLADGGLVRATPGGVLALLGEGGQDELVLPLSRARAFAPALAGAGAGGGGAALHVENYYEAARGNARSTAAELMWLAKGRG
jgi:hypothetical protein